MTTYEYHINRNIDCGLADRRSLDVIHAKRIVNITVGNKRRSDSFGEGESSHTISLNKEEVAMLIGNLQAMYGQLETTKE